MITGVVLRRSVWLRNLLSQDRACVRCVAECARSGKNIRKGIARGLDLQPLLLSRRDRDIDVIRIGGDPFDWPTLSPKLATDDTHTGAIVIGDFRNRARRNVLVAWVRHL